MDDDVPALPPTPAGHRTAGDPFAVFRHDRLPRWALVHRTFDRTEVADVGAAVAATFATVAERIAPGSRVALGVGSRGIDRLDEVVRATVRLVRERGAEPFIVPAMGSHGGATPEGQVAVLATLGVTEAAMGCPIRSSLETVRLGEVAGGVPVFVDRIAFEEADAIVPINRVKPHTDFSGPVESGLMKMIAIGLGDQHGADTFHSAGFAVFHDLIPEVARFTLAHAPIPFGIALVENGYARLRRIEAVPAEAIDARERELKAEAEALLARLPFEALDVLVLDFIGKDISGLGMDSNVVGRYYRGPTGQPPDIQRIYLRDLTDETEGNAVGIGMADVVHRRAVERMDRVKTYMNCVTAKTPEGARIAMTAESDRQALDLALAACLRVEAPTARVVRIRDTKHLEWFYASEPLLPALLERGDCELASEPREIAFDGGGAFRDALPDEA